jgi:hypothetical protein
MTNRGLIINLYINIILNKDIRGSFKISRFELTLLNYIYNTSNNISLYIRLVRLNRDKLIKLILGEIPLKES